MKEPTIERASTARLDLQQAALAVDLSSTLRPSSSNERLLRAALAEVELAGGRTLMLNGEVLDQPLYVPHGSARGEQTRRLLEALRIADGVIIASRGYHGTISGHIQNALDYIEDLRADDRPYLEGRAVGCSATAAGWQVPVTTPVTLRSMLRALRGWPTALGLTINSPEPLFAEADQLAKPQLKRSLRTLARQIVGFMRRQRLSAAS